ncbi:MAG TPA: type II toxin-antitoxin system VapC family toxin [Rhizomicrobium sp.]|nr:type II toxin-antitoxin system VapC family toxin [Rhizomicrobium sp.]
MTKRVRESIYLDAGVIVSIFLIDGFSNRADTYLRSLSRPVVVSDFASAEFISAVGRRLRMRELSDAEARLAISNFDGWRGGAVRPAETTSLDVVAAEQFPSRLDLVLRAPDALHIAIARRLGAELATFDSRMAECARALGAPVATL